MADPGQRTSRAGSENRRDRRKPGSTPGNVPRLCGVCQRSHIQSDLRTPNRASACIGRKAVAKSKVMTKVTGTPETRRFYDETGWTIRNGASVDRNLFGATEDGPIRKEL